MLKELHETAAKQRPRVLVVDDEPMNRELLAAYLPESDFELVEAASGAAALELVRQREPDIVLLDVMMPGMDGYETARQLKALAGNSFLPIILVTAHGDGPARLRGYEAGADEFLTKPLNRHELRARLTNLLQLRHERLELARRNEHLRQLQEFREQATSLLVHDLKNPLGTISLNVDYAAKAIEKVGGLDHAREALEDARSASRRLLRRIAEVLDTARAEEGRLVARRVTTRVQDVLHSALREFQRAAEEKALSLRISGDASLQFAIDQDLLHRTIENLLENALRFTPLEGRVELSAAIAGDALELLVCNDGPSIDPALRPHLFDRFTQGSSSEQTVNRGLGLYFCRLAIEAHGGRIEATQTDAFPTCFRILIPR